MPDYGKLIHYPAHWDTAAYPTLESAVLETLAWAGCSACKEPEAYGLTRNKSRDLDGRCPFLTK